MKKFKLSPGLLFLGMLIMVFVAFIAASCFLEYGGLLKGLL